MDAPRCQLPGIRSSSPQRWGEFHTMRPHAPQGFPGGRAQAYVQPFMQHPYVQSNPQLLAHMEQELAEATTDPILKRLAIKDRTTDVVLNDVREMTDQQLRMLKRDLKDLMSSKRLTLKGVGEPGSGSFSAAFFASSISHATALDSIHQEQRRRMRGKNQAVGKGKKNQARPAATVPGAGQNRPPSGATPVGPMGHGMGGEFHDEVIDIETTGLRTRRYHDRFQGRGIGERRIPMGITQITRRIHGDAGVSKKDIFTDVLDQEMLRRHGVTVEQLKSGKELPEGLYREVTARAGWRRGMRIPWDPSVRESGSVLDSVFRRSATELLEGNAVDTKSALKDILTDWKGMVLGKKKIVRLSGWNINFDFSEVAIAMRDQGMGKDLDMLLKKGGIVVRELGEHLHAMQFEHMLHSNWTPMMTDWKAVEIAHQMGLSPLDDVALKKLGAKGVHPLRQHNALRGFMDDLSKGVVGDMSGFKTRAQNWIAAKAGDLTQAESASHNLINRLSKIRTYEDFVKFAGQMQKEAYDPAFGASSLYDVLGEWYPTKGAKHIHILGDPDTMSVVGRATGQWGSINAFSMISGGKLEIMAQSMADHADQLGMDARTAERLKHLVKHAHDSSADTEMAEILHAETARVRRDEHLSKVFMQEQTSVHRTRSQSRLRELMMDVAQQDRAQKGAASGSADSIAKQLGGGGRRMGKRFGEVADNIKGPGWATMILGVTAMYLVGSHNQVEPPEKQEGMRREISQYDQIPGIDTSSLPFSNISAFGSGYSQFDNYMLSSRVERVRITKVEDGDTVEFYRDGKPVVARLAGIDTPELNDPHMGHRSRAERASQFLRSMIAGNEVTIRPMIGQTIDAYGRELVYLDYQGINVNRRMVEMGFSGAEGYTPPPYVSPSDHLSYIKFQMQRGVNVLKSIIEPFVGSSSVETPEYHWEVFGPIGDVPYTTPMGYHGEGGESFIHGKGEYSGVLGGYAGYVQNLSQKANMSKVRDYQTQLGRLPGQIRTPKGPHAMSMNSHAERHFHTVGSGGY